MLDCLSGVSVSFAGPHGCRFYSVFIFISGFERSVLIVITMVNKITITVLVLLATFLNNEGN